MAEKKSEKKVQKSEVKKPEKKKSGGLGRGLNSLFEDNKVDIEIEKQNNDKDATGRIMININQIDPNRKQPRTHFDEEKLEELAESIKEHGIIEPLVVKKSGNRYQIIAGERRWRAARKANLKEIPVVIGEYTDREIMEVALIENIQREDLNPIEEAKAYKSLIDEHGLRQEEVAERVSKKRVTITNSLRLLKLDERVQNMLIDGRLTGGHARALLAVEDNERQFALAEKVAEEKLSVREVEKLIRDLENEKNGKKRKNVKDEKNLADYKEFEKKLIALTGSKVEVKVSGENKGKIIIPYNSVEEFERVYAIFTKGTNK
ncbi:MAG: ParB/RepB/Spo0J family partition protein [Lachnospiraceae bacterium]|nr:ParB/RepB/Spo0J family partition protein [Lachnospiraceae bacterium]